MSRWTATLFGFVMVLLSSAIKANVCDPVCYVETDNGHYRLKVAPETRPVKLRTFHSWAVEVVDRQGKPVELKNLSVAGGMPAHGHGMPSQPKVSEFLGNGRYLINGMMFNMHGDWRLDFRITDGAEADTASLNITIDY